MERCYQAPDWIAKIPDRIRYEFMYCHKPSFEIEKVIFHDPATIIYWKDGTKTVVKVQERDCYDPEIGMVMAIAKKALGNKGNYYNVIKSWVNAYHEANPNISINPSEYPLLSTISFDGTDFAKKIRKAFGMSDQDD